MNTIEQIAFSAGKAFARFRAGLNGGKQERAALVTGMAEAARWQGGDYGRKGAQRRAISNSWFYTALNMISNEVSAGRLRVIDASGADDVEMPDHPLPRLLRRPNPWMGRSYLWQYSIAWLYLDGNAYWFVQCDEFGCPCEIWPLPAQDVEVVPGDGERFVDYYRYTANGRAYDIASEYIIHFQLPNPFDVFRGLSPLVAAMLPIDSDLAMAFWNGAFFGRDNVMPSSIINIKPPEGASMNDLESDIAAMKDDLREGYGAAKRRTLITAYDAVQAVLLGWNAKDMDFISGRQYSKEEIYQVLGVPSGLLDKNATEANATIADKVFKEKTIWPLMTLLAEQLTAQYPLGSASWEAAWDDIRPANRALELQEVAAAAGYLSVDEVRKKYWKLPPMVQGAGVAPQLPAPAEQPAPVTPQAADALRAWQTKALKALQKTGRAAVEFRTEYIPEPTKAAIINGLLQATNADEVRQVFDSAAHRHEHEQRMEPQIEGEFSGALTEYLNGLAGRIAEQMVNDHAAG